MTDAHAKLHGNHPSCYQCPPTKWLAKNTPPNKLVYVRSSGRVGWSPRHLMNVDQIPTAECVTICGARMVGSIPMETPIANDVTTVVCKGCHSLALRYSLFTKP